MQNAYRLANRCQVSQQACASVNIDKLMSTIAIKPNRHPWTQKLAKVFFELVSDPSKSLWTLKCVMIVAQEALQGSTGKVKWDAVATYGQRSCCLDALWIRRYSHTLSTPSTLAAPWQISHMHIIICIVSYIWRHSVWSLDPNLQSVCAIAFKGCKIEVHGWKSDLSSCNFFGGGGCQLPIVIFYCKEFECDRFYIHVPSWLA